MNKRESEQEREWTGEKVNKRESGQEIRDKKLDPRNKREEKREK